MNDAEKLLFKLMDGVESARKQAKNIAETVSEVAAPVAEEIVNTAAEHVGKAAATVSGEVKRAAEATENYAEKEKCKTLMTALAHYASKTSMSDDVVSAMYQVSSYYMKGTPIFTSKDKDSEAKLTLMMTALHSFLQKTSVQSYKQMAEWIVQKYSSNT